MVNAGITLSGGQFIVGTEPGDVAQISAPLFYLGNNEASFQNLAMGENSGASFIISPLTEVETIQVAGTLTLDGTLSVTDAGSGTGPDRFVLGRHRCGDLRRGYVAD